MILIRGGGDLASGVALRLHRSGMRVVITELPRPLAVRRMVSFAEAVYAGETVVEGISGHFVSDWRDNQRILRVLDDRKIAIIIDSEAKSVHVLNPSVVIDARMKKKPPELINYRAELFIGLGPGFEAGKNCEAAIETNRGHLLGRVIWDGKPQADTGIPEPIGTHREDRVLRAPSDGRLKIFADICGIIKKDQLIAEVNGVPIHAAFDGVLRGILHNDFSVKRNQKIGDLDPRGDPQFCALVSDKALAVGGGVLEAILSRADVRDSIWF